MCGIIDSTASFLSFILSKTSCILLSLRSGWSTHFIFLLSTTSKHVGLAMCGFAPRKACLAFLFQDFGIDSHLLRSGCDDLSRSESVLVNLSHFLLVASAEAIGQLLKIVCCSDQ